jgi:hypothetical protein
VLDFDYREVWRLISALLSGNEEEMSWLLRFIALAAVVGLIQSSDSAIAQSLVNQIKLTERQVEGFVASRKEIEAITPAKADPKLLADLEAICRKHGFKDLDEYEDVVANIAMVLAGINPQTGTFLDPRIPLKERIDEIIAAKNISGADRQRMLYELDEAMENAGPIKNLENIELVKKYYDKIVAVPR